MIIIVTLHKQYCDNDHVKYNNFGKSSSRDAVTLRESSLPS